jgi:hypothetical protein
VIDGRTSDEPIDDSGARPPALSDGCEVYLQSSQGILRFGPDCLVAPFQSED